MKNRITLALAALVALLAIRPGLAQPFPKAAPADLGFSAEKLDHIAAVLKEDTGKSVVPGAVILVVRHGKTAMFDAEGLLDPAGTAPMKTDAIFRIYSMSKAITSVSAMMLVEQGKLSLDDPVSKFIPAFAHLKVIVQKADPADPSKKVTELVDATHPILVKDLLRHTSGITYGFFGAGPGKKAYNDAKVLEGDYTNEEFADRIAKLPLSYEPGTTWDYSHSTDVLGRVVEVVSKKSLYEFEKEHLLKPLGMNDTAFYETDKSKFPRIAEPFPNDRTIGVGAAVGDPRVIGKWESGGGGMISTASDYSLFLNMLLHNGTVNGKTYLKAATVADMTSDHTQGITPGPYYLPGRNYGFGWGFAVRTKDDDPRDRGTAGEYNWNGVAGTNFWIDPKRDMFVVFMIQSPKQRMHYMSTIRSMVYDAITN